ncbi:MAG: protein-L-isoaspartate O-methyltransferase [Candidatus Colwellbacteria bacterium]|nr:protein-L-isoaspartate O-methyltransferase [Candidatus Colwellbacteria bacterium]
MSTTNNELVDELIRGGYLKTPTLIEAFREINRADFVPEELKDDAYVNAPLPIGQGQTISQPLTVAFMLELLLPQPGEKILDVGTGSGWQLALLAHVVGERGKVIGIERIEKLKKIAGGNINKYKELKGRAAIFLNDGSKGYEEGAPYDKIVAAAAADEIPPAWKEQLKTGGIIVAPVGASVVVMQKTSAEEFETREYYGFSFVPLVTDSKNPN